MRYEYLGIPVCLVFIFLFLIAFSQQAAAFRELPSDVGELSRASEDIVVAKCVKSEVKQDENTGFIFTYTTFRVDDSLKGEYNDEIVIKMIGGKSGNIETKVPHSTRFYPDEEVVLFLGSRNTKGYPVIKNTKRGIYRIKTDTEGRKVVLSPHSFSSGSEAEAKVVEPGAVLLDDFLNSISNRIN